MLRKLFGTPRAVRRPPGRTALLSAAAVAIALAGGAWGLHAADRPARCASPAGSLRVEPAGGECVGVTDGSFIFSPALAGVERDIARQNAAVVRGGHYVTVALLSPMTAGSGDGVVPASRVLGELDGAYAAQRCADSGCQGVQPRIQLLLANEGSQEQAWRQVTGQLAALRGGPSHLVAVIGLGVSTQQTIDGIRQLSRAHIPMVAATLTGDIFDGRKFPGLARVTPDVHDQVIALHRYLAGARGPSRRPFLVVDSDPEDIYATSLRADFGRVFGPFSGEEPFERLANPANEFRLMWPNICPASGSPPLVLYAGREVTLGTFITQLERAPSCDGEQLTIVTGADASTLDPRVTAVRSGLVNPARVTVIFAESADPARVQAPVQADFERSPLGSTASLSDTWTIGAYDAMAAAANDIAISTGASGRLPTLDEMRSDLLLMNGKEAVNGASGPFSIGPDGDASGQPVPVAADTAGGQRVLVP